MSMLKQSRRIKNWVPRAPPVSRTKTLVPDQATQLLVQIINPPTGETFHPKGRSAGVVAHIRVRAHHLHNPADVQVKHPVVEAVYSAPLAIRN
jgi:hypothetical protein